MKNAIFRSEKNGNETRFYVFLFLDREKRRTETNTASSPMVSAQVRLALQAMRYYRLWIYASNVVLVAGVVIFASVAAALLADPRRHLLPAADVAPHQPSVVYAYVALVLQGAVLPVVGCIGALKLSEKLLNSYWLLLLILLAGDLLVGVVWVFRFQRLVVDIVPDLKSRLASDYGTDEQFTNAWDLLQQSARCCGVDSPADYNNTHWMSSVYEHPSTSAALTSTFRRSHSSSNAHYTTSSHRTARPTLVTTSTEHHRLNRMPVPRTCCKSASLTNEQLRLAGFVSMANEVPPGRKEVYGTGKHRQQLRDYNERLHAQLMREQFQLQQQLANSNLSLTRPTFLGPPSFGTRHQRRATTVDNSKASKKEQHTTRPNRHKEPGHSTTESTLDDECIGMWPNNEIHEPGCGEFVLSWLHRTGDTLFVLGYCVLAFVKLCFLAILRYELREMVLKIKILQSEQALALAAGNNGGNGLPFTHHEMSGIRAVMARSGQHPTPPAVVATDAAEDDAQVSPDVAHSPVVPNGEVPCRYESFSDPTKDTAKKLDSPPDTPLHRPNNDPDSDSGSHCPLLPSSSQSTGQPVRRVIKEWESGESSSWVQPLQHVFQQQQHRSQLLHHEANGWPARSPNGNNNEYHELREIKQTQI